MEAEARRRGFALRVTLDSARDFEHRHDRANHLRIAEKRPDPEDG